MTTRRRFQPRRAVSRKKKRTVWENLQFVHSHIAAASLIFLDLTPEPMSSDLVGTAKCLRILGHHSSAPDAGSLLDSFGYGIGITVMTNDAFTAGAVPDPLTDFQQSWYYWDIQQNRVATNVGLTSRPVYFDMRTQRVLRSGFKLALVTQTLIEDQAQFLDVTMRLLWEIN